MSAEKRKIFRPDSPADGPTDGIQMETDCIRTDFDCDAAGKARLIQSERRDSHISASVEIGIFSIRDMESGVMLTVLLQDAMEVVAAAVAASKEAGDE